MAKTEYGINYFGRYYYFATQADHAHAWEALKDAATRGIGVVLRVRNLSATGPEVGLFISPGADVVITG